MKVKDVDNKQKQKERPKYNMWQNSAYMINEAWKVRRSVVFLCLILAILAVATNLAELFVAPVILEKVEAAVPLGELISTIVLFSFVLLVLAALKAYAVTNTLFGRIEVRLSIIHKIHNKVATTSFPNTEDTSVLKKLEKSNMAVSDNKEATEEIWNTLTELLKT
jgi:ATP-binding cassette subfamily B protein